MNSKYLVLTLGALSLVTLLPHAVLAQTYLVGIPGVDDPGLEFGDYINALYALSISVGALLAVIKIIIAGMKWMLSDIVTSKQEAISDIRGSVLGLIIVISAVLVLRVINPQLAETTIFLDPVDASTSTPPVATGPGAISGTGFEAVPTNTEPGFEADCLASNGKYTLESLNGTPYKACFEPLNSATIDSINALFTNQSTSTIIANYQTTHVPKLRSLTSIPASSLRTSTTTVLFAVNFTAPGGDFIDQRQPDKVRYLCGAYARQTGLPVYFWGDATRGYLSCVH